MAQDKIIKFCSIDKCENIYFSIGLCRKHYNSEYSKKRRANPEYLAKMKEYQQKWYLDNKKRLDPIYKKYREANREKRNEQIKKWHKKHYLEQLEAKKQYYQSNKTRISAYKKQYAKESRHIINSYRKKWEQTWSPEYKRARDGQTKKIRKTEIPNWFIRICGICNLLIEDKFEIDHIKPLSRGGKHDVSNLQLAHPKCNRSKNNKLPEEYQQYLKEKTPGGV